MGKIVYTDYLFASLSYSDTLHKLHEEINKNKKFLKKEGWKLFSTSLENYKTNLYGLKAIIFVNHETMKAHLSIAGTELTEIWDLIDDLLITFGYIPYKFEIIKIFINHILQLNQILENYTLSISGHSLGGIISELAGLYLLSLGVKISKITTFDNPGSRNIIEYIHKKLLTIDIKVKISDLSKICITYNVKPNFINTTNPPLAEKIYLIFHTKKHEAVIDVIKNKTSGLFGFIKHLVGNTISKFCNFISEITYLEKIYNDLKSHNISHFNPEDNPIFSRVIKWANWNNNELEFKAKQEYFDCYDDIYYDCFTDLDIDPII
jgi:hypothetical protein